MNKLSLAAVGLALIANVDAARAQLLGPSEGVSCVYTPIGGTSTIVDGTSSCSVTDAQASISTSPAVSITASGTGPQATSASQAEGSLSYQFEVVGGTPDQQVPILVTTDLTTAISGNASASASIKIFSLASDLGFGDVQAEVCSNINGCGSESPSFDGTLDATAFADEAAEVSISFGAGGGGNAVEGGTAGVSVDPLIEIDPTYLLANPGLTLEFSPGVGNGLPAAPQPVPEPPSLALLAAGMAALAAWRRRQVRTGHNSGKRPVMA